MYSSAIDLLIAFIFCIAKISSDYISIYDKKARKDRLSKYYVSYHHWGEMWYGLFPYWGEVLSGFEFLSLQNVRKGRYYSKG